MPNSLYHIPKANPLPPSFFSLIVFIRSFYHYISNLIDKTSNCIETMNNGTSWGISQKQVLSEQRIYLTITTLDPLPPPPPVKAYVVSVILLSSVLVFFFLHLFHVLITNVGIVNHPLVDCVSKICPWRRFSLDIFILQNNNSGPGLNRQLNG